MRMNDVAFPGRFEAARRPGAYLRIIEPGQIAAGDRIEVTPAEQPALTIAALAAADLETTVLRQIVDDRRVPDSYRRAAARALAA
jgi:MOSC domain-containing protein YiiM